MLCLTRDSVIMKVQKEIPPLHCRFGNLTGDAGVESPSRMGILKADQDAHLLLERIARPFCFF